MALYTPEQGTPRSQGVSGVHGCNGEAPAHREEAESGRHPAPSRKAYIFFGFDLGHMKPSVSAVHTSMGELLDKTTASYMLFESQLPGTEAKCWTMSS